MVEQENHNNASDEMLMVEKPVLQVTWLLQRDLLNGVVILETTTCNVCDAIF